MNRIPLPVIIALIVIAVILGALVTRRTMSGGLPEPKSYPTGPPAAAMEHFRNPAMGAQSGQSGGMSGGANVAAPAGNPAGH
jgi:hypothetical protein